MSKKAANMSKHKEEVKTSKEPAMDKDPWRWISEYLLAPCDPSNLAILRILFGLFMMIDIPQERGLANLHNNWEEQMCYFPLFNWLHPLSLDWMHVVYMVMLFGAVGIMLGFLFRISCLMFLVPYWYIFWLDKGVWNNHSYLYGLFSILLLMTDSNRYLSLDGLLNPNIRNADIPRWNYFLFRFQIFLVYFFAGIKKLDQDWMGGYSMTGLSRQWVFDPFRPFLSDEIIDLVLVHICGLCFDLFVGFFLIFDKTRPIGICFALSFNAMNSQMFNIGMFSYTMMATLPLFCATNWPKKLISKLPSCLRYGLPILDAPQPSSHCLYTDSDSKQEANGEASKKKEKSTKFSAKRSGVATQHKAVLTVFACYVMAQLFLPYSHFITKGYNGWTQGLYGYSWDMMVHSWSTQHVRIKVIDRANGKEIFIRPGTYIGGGRRRHSRWTSHPDMIKQYVTCLAEKLKVHPDLKITEPAIYLDVWRSMNNRFNQRFVSPNVDLVTAEWSPVRQTPWVQPLLMELSPWRTKLKQIEKELKNSSLANFTDIVFVADFPGLMLENYMSAELNTTLTVLDGEVAVEFDGKNHTLGRDEELRVPSNATHMVYTVSPTPACWMYIYLNMTMLNNQTIRAWISNPETRPGYERKEARKNMTFIKKFKEFSQEKFAVFYFSFWNSYYAIGHLVGLENPFDQEDQSGNANSDKVATGSSPPSDTGSSPPSETGSSLPSETGSKEYPPRQDQADMAQSDQGGEGRKDIPAKAEL